MRHRSMRAGEGHRSKTNFSHSVAVIGRRWRFRSRFEDAQEGSTPTRSRTLSRPATTDDDAQQSTRIGKLGTAHLGAAWEQMHRHPQPSGCEAPTSVKERYKALAL